MYCRKCGKPVEGDELYCKDCQQQDLFFDEPAAPKVEEPQQQPAQAPVQAYQQAPQQVQTDDKRAGFGGALAATIMGSIAFFLSIFAMAFATIALEEASFGYMSGMSGATAFFCLAAIGLSIPSLIKGIAGIKCFIRAKREGKAKPVATLICGIVGVVMSGLAFIYLYLAFFMLFMLAFV